MTIGERYILVQCYSFATGQLELQPEPETNCRLYNRDVNGPMGQWVTKDDPFPSLLYNTKLKVRFAGSATDTGASIESANGATRHRTTNAAAQHMSLCRCDVRKYRDIQNGGGDGHLATAGL